MKIIKTIKSAIDLVNRIVSAFDEYKKQRQQTQRKKRRDRVRANPARAMADLFGDHERVRNDAEGDFVRPDPAKNKMDKNK